jgi:hypothetical protein
MDYPYDLDSSVTRIRFFLISFKNQYKSFILQLYENILRQNWSVLT